MPMTLPWWLKTGTAGATRSCLGVVDNLVRKHVAQMSLGDERPDEILLGQAFENLLRVTVTRADNGANRGIIGPR
jgi:hypothetical protein